MGPGGGAEAEFAAELRKFLHLEGEFPHCTRRPQPVNHATRYAPFLLGGGARV